MIKRGIKAKKYSIFLFILLAFFLGIYGLNQFKIKKVYVVSSKKINLGLEILNKENLLFLKTDKISRYFLLQNTEIQSVHIEKVIPQSLVISIIFRQPIAKITNTLNQIFAIDSEGVLLPFEDNPSTDRLLIEAASTPLFLGIKPDWRILKTVEYINNLEREGLSANRIIIDGKMLTLHIFLQDGIEVIVPQGSDAPFLVTSLQIITSRFRIEGKLITSVDFRFEKPIIIFSNGEKISSE